MRSAGPAPSARSSPATSSCRRRWAAIRAPLDRPVGDPGRRRRGVPRRRQRVHRRAHGTPARSCSTARFARFNPTNPDYDLETWLVRRQRRRRCRRRHRPRLTAAGRVARRHDPVHVRAVDTGRTSTDGDIAGQYVTDATAVGKYGLRTWSAENLLTFGGASTTANAETKLYADYVRDNYTTPRVRVGQLTIKPRRPNPDVPA